MSVGTASGAPAANHTLGHGPPDDSYSKRLIRQHARLLNALAFFAATMVLFVLLEPDVFLRGTIYTSVFTSVPLLMLMAVPAVFVITSGELDLSFPGVFAAAAYGFATAVDHGVPFGLSLAIAVCIGLVLGFVNGVLVTNVGLSSLVVTLGMNFLLRGLVFVVSDGNGIVLSEIRSNVGYRLLVGELGSFPVQMLWGLVAGAVGVVLFAVHKFGVHVRCVGDNPGAAREMGISVSRTRTAAFMYMGASAAVAGVMSTLSLNTWFPGAGEGYLLLVLASVFVGGTPTWGGVGTAAGGVVGALFIGFAETGIIAVGLTGFYTQLIFGLIIILSIAGQRVLPGGTER